MKRPLNRLSRAPWRGLTLALALLTLIPFLPAAAQAQEKEITITGSVEKAAVDENDKVIAVEIWAEGPNGTEYYLVNDDAKGAELLGLAGKRVRATGAVEEDEDGNKIIMVKEFTVK